MYILIFDGEKKDSIYNVMDIPTSEAFRKDGSFCSIVKEQIKKASDREMKIVIKSYEGQQ